PLDARRAAAAPAGGVPGARRDPRAALLARALPAARAAPARRGAAPLPPDLGGARAARAVVEPARRRAHGARRRRRLPRRLARAPRAARRRRRARRLGARAVPDTRTLEHAGLLRVGAARRGRQA